MTSDSESKNGSKTEKDKERQNQAGEEVPRAPERFNWADYHQFVAMIEGVQINAYSEETEKSFKSIKAFK